MPKFSAIPKSVTYNTGDQGEITKVMDDFFNEIVDYLKKKSKADTKFLQLKTGLEIKTGEIAYDCLTPVVTDHRVTYLVYKQRVLAMVLETRTESNYIHYDFFRNLEGLEVKVLSKEV